MTTSSHRHPLRHVGAALILGELMTVARGSSCRDYPTPPEPPNAPDNTHVRPWYRRKRFVIPLGLLILLLILPLSGGDPAETEEAAQIDEAQPAEVVTETVTEIVTETVTEEVTEVVTERDTDELNRLRRIARERKQTIDQLRERIHSLEDQVAVGTRA